ncbi:MAG: hypothetical protein HBSAPP03_07010 [Phycisphaerae bacterium]|nr:MAG: hypothetical protein HBSAPP03_07010 [Phycisphaerae bacterium]
MISYIIPTRDRPQRLRDTLARLDALGPHPDAAELIVIDNDSRERLVLPPSLPNGLRVREIALAENLAAASRNLAAQHANPANPWLVMLDDDSFPLDLRFLSLLEHQPIDVAALAADIALPSGLRESGGLPEVFVGCGVAIRRDAFLRLGGYDPAFGFYAEEYDLAARLLLAGFRVAFDPRFRIRHDKSTVNRSMNLILARLVRNSSFVTLRYAPRDLRAAELRAARRRYRAIAEKEHALHGFARGLRDLRAARRAQPHTPLPPHLWDRFTGLAHARLALAAAHAAKPFHSAAIVDHGKNAHVVAHALHELGVRIIGDGEDADALVIGTMSPGPMLDALQRRSRWLGPHAPRVIAPWAIPPVRPAPRRIAA